MRTYKFLVAGFAVLSLLGASAASAQTATTTSVVPSGTADLGIVISGSGVTLDATRSSVPIQVLGLPLSFSGSVGGSCMISNAGTTVGTVGSDARFTTPVTVPAGSSVTLPVTCTGATPGTYSVSMTTSAIPAIVAGTNRSITPHGAGNTTMASGTLTIGGAGTGSVTGTGSVLGTTTTSANLPGATNTSTSGSGSAVLGTSTGTPNVPNTGDGGTMAMNLTILALAGLAAVGGSFAMRRFAR